MLGFKKPEISKPALTVSNSYYVAHFVLNSISIMVCGIGIFSAYLLDFERHAALWLFRLITIILLGIIVFNILNLHKLEKAWRTLAGLELRRHYPERFK